MKNLFKKLIQLKDLILIIKMISMSHTKPFLNFLILMPILKNKLKNKIILKTLITIKILWKIQYKNKAKSFLHQLTVLNKYGKLLKKSKRKRNKEIMIKIFVDILQDK